MWDALLNLWNGKMENLADYKQFIQNGFDQVSAGYDHPALFFFPETAKRIVRYLNMDADLSLLDVCTGTGVVALRAAEQLTKGRVVGIDLSSGMLTQAKEKASQLNLSNVSFQQMDMENLEFEDACFDVATSSFGLFFIEDMKRGLRSIASKVKPGGKIAISSFTGEAFSPMADVFIKDFEATGHSVPSLSWRRLASHELIAEQFNVLGISKIKTYHEKLGYQMTSADMWWDVLWNAGWRSLLNQFTGPELKEFKAMHLANIAKIIGDDGLWFNTEVLIAIAEKG